MANETHLLQSSAEFGERLLTTREAAIFLCVSKAFLDRDRWVGRREGCGPRIPYVRVGRRTVRYRPSDLAAHIRTHRQGGTTK